MPFLRALGVLLGFQLLGELLSRFTGLPVPGPVIGLVLLVVWLAVAAYYRGGRPDFADSAADGILGNLGLLFVPAGVGVIGQLAILGAHWAGIVFVLAISTVLTMLATVGAFLAVSRLLGKRT